MNFFEQQARSRKKTTLLLFLFFLAVAIILVVVYFAVWATLVAFAFYGHGVHGPPAPALWDLKLFLQTTAGTLAVIFASALYMHMQLSGGGASVATLLGGRSVAPETADPSERRLRNVVEEMAIASGVPIPHVFVLPGEPGINAFAAGFTPGDAAVTVTQGALQTLTRDELQGVVAHEFSHIFNGDMRLNVRLTSVLFGILGIATAGQWIFRLGAPGRRSRGKGAPPIALLGLALLVIGYIGVFFGRLIKSAVSRQREFLADAAAVQFTRNPSGIAGALKKIGGYSEGSAVSNHNAETVSHMFFGAALKEGFFRLLETHPPLSERIRFLDPSFRDQYPELEIDTAGVSSEEDGPAVAFASGSAPASNVSSARVFINVGSPKTEHLRYAGAFLSSLPIEIVNAAHEPSGARALVYGLLLSPDAVVRERQISAIGPFEGADILGLAHRFKDKLQDLGPRARMPLLRISLPALRNLGAEEFGRFRATLKALLTLDDEITLFDFIALRILWHHLKGARGRVSRNTILHRTFPSVREDCRVLLSALAHEGAQETEAAEAAFVAGWVRMTNTTGSLLPRDRCGLEDLQRSLDRMLTASFSLRGDLLEAAARTVSKDGQVTLGEAELLAGIGELLDCPVPPLVSRGALRCAA